MARDLPLFLIDRDESLWFSVGGGTYSRFRRIESSTDTVPLGADVRSANRGRYLLASFCGWSFVSDDSGATWRAGLTVPPLVSGQVRLLLTEIAEFYGPLDPFYEDVPPTHRRKEPHHHG